MNNTLANLLTPRMVELLERCGIATTKQIITLSSSDIEKKTSLSREDVIFIKNTVSEHVSPKSITCDFIDNDDYKIRSGCAAIDKLLDGGFRRKTITEIYGESGSGKTQIGLQAAAYNWPHYSVYICTEDLFPIKRFNDIKKGTPNFNHHIDYGSNVFVEHITEAVDLLSCVRVRLPKLLEQNEFTFVVIDSVAAVFRVESTNYIQRAEDLREIAISLLTLANKFNLAVLCINQVTASLEGSVDLLPSLGLAWSNMVSTRLHLKKSHNTLKSINEKEQNLHIRELSVTFAPDLPNSSAYFVITKEGLRVCT